MLVIGRSLSSCNPRDNSRSIKTMTQEQKQQERNEPVIRGSYGVGIASRTGKNGAASYQKEEEREEKGRKMGEMAGDHCG